MENKDTKIVIESNLMDQVWYQIDRYLQKKWPDIFIHDELKVLKEKIENGLQHLEEDQMRVQLYRERELRIDRILAEMQTEISILKEKVQALDSTEELNSPWKALLRLWSRWK